jgi:hypothetical protein
MPSRRSLKARVTATRSNVFLQICVGENGFRHWRRQPNLFLKRPRSVSSRGPGCRRRGWLGHIGPPLFIVPLALATLPTPRVDAATTMTPSATRACLAMANHPVANLAMPTPTRLSKRLIINLGTEGPDTLLPPLTTQHSIVSTNQLRSFWRSAGEKQPSATYRLVIARFTSRLPATTNLNGQLVPAVNQQLAWVLIGRHLAVNMAGISGPPQPGRKAFSPAQCLYDGVAVRAWSAVTGDQLDDELYVP